MQCPKCTGSSLTAAGPHQGCAQCGGLFVTEASFDDMLATMSAGADVMRSLANYPIGVERCAHVCPRCDNAMVSSSIEGLPVERCAMHGIWFDRTELERALAQDVPADEAQRGEGPLGRVAEVGVGVVLGGAIAMLARYIARLMRHS